MDKVDMRASFKRRAHGLANSLSNGVIDKYMSHAYQHAIPDVVPGQLSEGYWTLTTVALTSEYEFPDYVNSVKRTIRIGDNWLDQHDRETDFYVRYDPSATVTGQPNGVLMYGRTLIFRPNPDAEYTVTIPVRKYPTDDAGTALGTIGDTGIVWYTHANAIIWRSLVEFAEDYDLAGLEARAEAKAARAEKKMLARGVNRTRRRRARRSF